MPGGACCREGRGGGAGGGLPRHRYGERSAGGDRRGFFGGAVNLDLGLIEGKLACRAVGGTRQIDDQLIAALQEGGQFGPPGSLARLGQRSRRNLVRGERGEFEGGVSQPTAAEFPVNNEQQADPVCGIEPKRGVEMPEQAGRPGGRKPGGKSGGGEAVEARVGGGIGGRLAGGPGGAKLDEMRRHEWSGNLGGRVAGT